MGEGVAVMWNRVDAKPWIKMDYVVYVLTGIERSCLF